MKLVGYYNRSVYLTYLGLASSMLGMTLAVKGRVEAALSCLLFSGLCDMFDGTVAQHTPRSEAEKKFGIQIDSLCDVICFCAFPALMSYTLGAQSVWALLSMAFFVTCGVIRLGYFNVQEEMRQQQTSEKRTSYRGLPVTTTALIFPFAVVAFYYLGASPEWAMPLLMAAVGVAFVADMAVVKPQGKAKLLLLGAGVLIFVGVLLSRRGI